MCYKAVSERCMARDVNGRRRLSCFREASSLLREGQVVWDPIANIGGKIHDDVAGSLTTPTLKLFCDRGSQRNVKTGITSGVICLLQPARKCAGSMRGVNPPEAKYDLSNRGC